MAVDWSEVDKDKFEKDFTGKIFNGRYVFLKVLGAGGFGCAALVKDAKDNDLHKVMKIAIFQDSMKPDEILRYSQEAVTLCRLNHPHIIKYYDSFPIANSYYIVTEFCEGGDLDCKLESLKRVNHRLSNDEVVKWIFDLILALDYLHNEHNIIHRDIKTLNIFLTNNNLKLGDFGLAVQVAKTDVGVLSAAGSMLYFSPEIWKSLLTKNPFIATKESDCWALGVVIYVMCTFDYPFKSADAVINNRPMEIPDTYSSYIREIINGLLNKNPRGRLTISQIKKSLTDNMDVDRRARTLEAMSRYNTRNTTDSYSSKPAINEETKKRMQSVHNFTEHFSSVCELM